jgi:molybdopterin-containing oxidoreductase family iron-sulfur binding subunit
MDRREFLSGGVAAAAAGLALDACAPESYGIIPVLVPEEAFVPGEESWLASTCFECEARCGIRVRKIDGRLTKVEGDPADPVSGGGVCARGQALPQAMYHPDRIQSPLVREGEKLVEASWDDALARVASEIARAREEGGDGAVGFITGESGGHRLRMVERFLAAVGGRRLRHAPFDRAPIRNAHEMATGQASVFDFDMARAAYVVSFGAEILESERSPVRFARALAEMRQGRPGRRGKFVMIGPRLSLTAANADEWVPARPGLELDVALALSAALLENGLGDSAFSGARAAEIESFRSFLFERARPAEVAERTGVPLARIERIAAELAEHRPALAIAGDQAPGTRRGVAIALAVSHLNALLGAYADGGLLGPESAPPAFAPWPNAGSAEVPALSLESELDSSDGLPRVLFVADANPAYSLPRSREALSRSFVVSFASLPDETAGIADVVLPESMSFERFADAVPASAVPHARLSSPLLMRPIHDTRSMEDTLIALAHRLELRERFPWESYDQALREAWAPLGSWDENLSRGGVSTAETKAPFDFATRYRFALGPIETALGEPVGSGRLLHVYPSTAFGDGRSARLPYLQDLADPITGVRWGSVVEIAESDARELGIQNGEVVELAAGETRVSAPAFVTPGIVPGVVALAAGQGHTAGGRHAAGRGVNAYTLLEGNFEIQVRRAEREPRGALSRSVARSAERQAAGVGSPRRFEEDRGEHWI